MMFGADNLKSIVALIDYDPAADKVIPLFVAPKALEIKAAKATVIADVSGSTANYFSLALRNGGAAGTATTAMAAAIGGTPGWTGGTPKSFTISEGTLAAGDVVTLVYDEEGTGTFGVLAVQLDYVEGVGA